MMKHSRDREGLGYGLYVFLSNVPLAAAVMFAMGMFFWPKESFPVSYTLMFSLAPKWAYGVLLSITAFAGYWAIIDGRRKAWRQVNLGISLIFFLVASLFVLPGSITGVSTYSVIGGHALLHFFDKWIPIGFLPQRLSD